MAEPLCHECLDPDEDPTPWCECSHLPECPPDRACRERSHDPEACPLRDAWAPLDRAWRHIEAGDLIVGRGGELWTVEVHTAGRARLTRPGAKPWSGTVDPDDTVRALVPYVERGALVLCDAALGARLIGRTA